MLTESEKIVNGSVCDLLDILFKVGDMDYSTYKSKMLEFKGGHRLLKKDASICFKEKLERSQNKKDSK